MDTTDANITVDVDDALVNLTIAYGLSNSSSVELIITSVPTSTPSFAPVTSIPSATPSFTGLIVSVSIQHIVTGELSDSDFLYLEEVVANAYGVLSEDVSSVTKYTISGSMDAIIPSSTTEEEAIQALTDALAEALDVSVHAVTISINSETGDVTYSVTSTDYDDATKLLATLEDESIGATLTDSTGVLTVASVLPDAAITAEVIISVDADEVTVPLESAENQVEAVLGSDYESTSDRIIHITKV